VYVRWSSTGSVLFLLNIMIRSSLACLRKKNLNGRIKDRNHWELADK
jgi:hypothetical protein